MKKLLFSISFILVSGIMAMGQTTATDFTAADCNSTSHTLFTELNGGNIVVLVWVMPCGGCISDGKASYDAAMALNSAYPGRVRFWLADDQGNSSCAIVSDWANANSIQLLNIAIFDNAGNAIDQANYGGIGMPHVVVLGGADHHVFYNKISGSNDSAAVAIAINNAFTNNTTGIGNVINGVDEVTLFPNPAKDKIVINYNLASASRASFAVYDEVGRVVETLKIDKQNAGNKSVQMPFCKNLPKGNYFLKLTVGNASKVVKFTIGD